MLDWLNNNMLTPLETAVSSTWLPLTIIVFMATVIITIVLSFPLLVYVFFAPRNLFCTFVKEGHAKVIMKGEDVVRIIINHKGHKILSSPSEVKRYNVAEMPETPAELWDVVPLGSGEVEDEGTMIESWFGYRWVGIPPFRKIYTYRFHWSHLPKDNTQGDAQQKEIISRDEIVESILLQEYVYVGQSYDAETGGSKIEDGKKILVEENMPVIFVYLLTVHIKNPHKALFAIHDWLPSTLAQTNTKVRGFVGDHTFAELNADDSKEKEINNAAFNTHIRTNIAQNIRDRYGVVYIDASMFSIKPGSADGEEYRRSSTKKYMATREGEAKLVEAEFRAKEAEQDAKVIERIATAKAFELQKLIDTIKSSPEAASTILAYQATLALAASSNKTYIIPPGLMPFMGGREKLTPEDINQILQTVTKEVK